MKPVLLTSTLSPAAGGLSASVPNLVKSIVRQEQVDVHVVGVEDPNDRSAATSWGPKVHAHISKGIRAFNYAPNMEQTLAHLLPDVIDLQGLWTYPSLALHRHHRRHGTPYVITPHGMLDPWARKRSWLKKKAVRLWFENANLASATCLRATAEMEAEHFRSFGLKCPIAIVPNGVDVPDLDDLPRERSKRRRILFLSRIHPKKGIAHLLRVWDKLEASHSDWELVIAGPDEVNHTADMKALAARLGVSRVSWMGSVHGANKAQLYRSADLFVLPTHAENFGLVVAEALAHEVPVITTRNAPWEGLEHHNCGWWIPLDEQSLQDAMTSAMTQSRSALDDMGRRGRDWMAREFGWDGISARMLEVYHAVANGGTLPNWVRYD